MRLNCVVVSALMFGHTALACGQLHTTFGTATNSPFVELRARQPKIPDGINVNRCFEDDLTMLHAACYWGHLSVVETLINRGADPTARCIRGGTPLHYAVFMNECEQDSNAFQGKVSLCQMLLPKCDPNIRDAAGNTPLHIALSSHFPGSAKYAAECIEIIKLLLKAGAAVNATNSSGATALHLAVQGSDDTEQTLIYELLLGNGANPNLPDNTKMTPLCFAVMRGLSRVCEYLLRNGANPQTRSPEGVPLVICATRNNDTKALLALLSRRVDVNDADTDGNCALHCVTEPKIARMLILAGADLNTSNRIGETPLDAAKRRGNVLLVKYLTSKGARSQRANRSVPVSTNNIR